MKNILVFATVALVVVFSAAQNRGRVCNSRNIRRPKCVPGKGGCLARVIGASYTTKQITPRGFVVSWTKHRAAICYYLEVLRGYTTFPVKTVHCYKGTSYKFTGLSPWTTYGVRVSLVNRWCGRGPPSRPVLYIKTNWDNTYVFPTKEVKTNVMTPVPGKCGQFRYTCVKSKFKQRNECIPNNKWCDRLMDCEDGSDERYCPGGCEEITEAPKNGNHSCTKFGSPGSYCFFDCFAGYVREGGSYLRCEKGIGKSPGKWSAPVPICRLPATESLEVVPESITSVSISVKWVEIANAFQYVVIAMHHTIDEGDSESDVTISTTVNATSCCGSVLNGLSPDTEYEVTIYAIDIDGTRGVRSASLFIRTGETTTVVVATEATTAHICDPNDKSTCRFMGKCMSIVRLPHFYRNSNKSLHLCICPTMSCYELPERTRCGSLGDTNKSFFNELCLRLSECELQRPIKTICHGACGTPKCSEHKTLLSRNAYRFGTPLPTGISDVTSKNESKNDGR